MAGKNLFDPTRYFEAKVTSNGALSVIYTDEARRAAGNPDGKHFEIGSTLADFARMAAAKGLQTPVDDPTIVNPCWAALLGVALHAEPPLNDRQREAFMNGVSQVLTTPQGGNN